MDDDMEAIENNYVNLTKQLLNEGHDPHKVAVALTALSMNMYSELLTEEEYTNLLLKLYDNQKNKPVEKFITIH